MNKTLMLNELKRHYNFSKDVEFAEFLGISPSVLSNWKARNTFDSELIYTKCEGVNPEWVLTGKGLKFSKKTVKGEKPYTSGVKTLTARESSSNYPALITVDQQGEENILLVPVAAQAGYLNGYDDPEYISDLPTYRLPKLSNGTFRMFEVKGHSMYPTLHDGSIVIGEWVERPTDIKDDRIYIVVSRENGIVIKRVLNRLEKYGNLYLKSDNRREYPSYPINKPDIVEVWELKASFSFEFQNPASLYDRINDLEAEMLEIKRKVHK